MSAIYPAHTVSLGDHALLQNVCKRKSKKYNKNVNFICKNWKVFAKNGYVLVFEKKIKISFITKNGGGWG